MRKSFWLNEKISKFINDNYQGCTPANMTKLVKEHFGTDVSIAQMKYHYEKNKLNSGLTGKFTKGHVSWNKDKKIENWVFSEESIEKMKGTWFKQGHKAWSGKPIGSETVKNKTVWLKISDKTWVRKHIYIWEKAYGKIEPNQIVIFKDGDRTNCNLDNLMLIDRNENLQLNHKNWRFKNQSDLQEAALYTVRLKKELKNESRSRKS